ncbi:MAG: hypothetical protein QGG40_17140 [Myxococcota bacterium]|nr:hypothetical protein [Myxococcota bacterium]
MTRLLSGVGTDLFRLFPLVLPVMACANLRYSEVFEPTESIHRIVVYSDAGQIELLPGASTIVERDIRAPEGALSLSHRVEDGTLVLQARCHSLVPCAVDTKVTVPREIPVEVRLGEGTLWATGIAALVAEVDEGTADVDVLGQLDLQVGRGEVQASVAADQSVRIAVGSGDITVHAQGTHYEMSTFGPRLQVEGLVDSATSSGRLELVAPAGKIRVTGPRTVAEHQPLAREAVPTP